MPKELWLSHEHKEHPIEVERLVDVEVDRLTSTDGLETDIGLYLELDDRHVRVRLGPRLALVLANAIDKTIGALAAEAIVDDPETQEA